jgi:serine/threonine protein kinase
MTDQIRSGQVENRGQRPLSFGEYHGMVSASYDDPLFLEAIRAPEEIWGRPGAEILLDKRNRVGVLSFRFSGGKARDIVVKEFSCRGVNKLKSFILPSKAARAWRGALTLKGRGLETAAPVAYLEKRKGGSIEKSFFLAEKINGAVEIRELFRRLPQPELGRLLAALAGRLSLWHKRGILHRDLSDGNILVKQGPEGEAVFYLLDTNRIRVRRKISRPARAKNLIRLGVPSPLQKAFLKDYLAPGQLGTAFWLWYRMNKTVYTAYVAMKRKVRLRQIARRLGVQ